MARLKTITEWMMTITGIVMVLFTFYAWYELLKQTPFPLWLIIICEFSWLCGGLITWRVFYRLFSKIDVLPKEEK
jgi:dolichol kinase